MESMNLYDLIIIGAGPAGSTAALYAARAELRTLVLSRPGRSGSLAKADLIANWPGAEGPLAGIELLARMRTQAEGFGAAFRTMPVSAVAFEGETKMVFGNAGETLEARAVLIATGALERKAHVPGEEKFLGRGVSVCGTCDGALYRGKTVIVAGNDDCAADECLALARFAARQYFLCPTQSSAISPALLQAMEAHPSIEFRRGWGVREIQGDDSMRAILAATPEGEVRMEADGIFMLLGGAKPTTGFLYGMVPTNDDGAILVHPDFSTAVPRVYAAGDVTANHPVRQAVVAAADGCVAALAVERDLRGRARLKADYHKALVTA